MKAMYVVCAVALLASSGGVWARPGGEGLTFDKVEAVATTDDEARLEQRFEIQGLMKDMVDLDATIEDMLSQSEKLDAEAQAIIQRARRANANARAAGQLGALLVGAVGTADMRMSGHHGDTWDLAADLSAESTRNQNYRGNRRMNAAVGKAQGPLHEAANLRGQAGDFGRDLQRLSSELDKHVMRYIHKVNKIVSSIGRTEGADSVDMGEVKDLAFDPAAARDKAFSGPMIYSLTFEVNGWVRDVRLVDLEQFVDDNFDGLVAERTEALEAAKALMPDKLRASLAEQIGAQEALVDRLGDERKEAKAIKDRAVKRETRADLKGQIREAKAELRRLKGEYGNLKYKSGRKAQQQQAEAAIAEASYLLQVAIEAQAILSTLNKDDVARAIQEIKGLI